MARGVLLRTRWLLNRKALGAIVSLKWGSRTSSVDGLLRVLLRRAATMFFHVLNNRCRRSSVSRGGAGVPVGLLHLPAVWCRAPWGAGGTGTFAWRQGNGLVKRGGRGVRRADSSTAQGVQRDDGLLAGVYSYQLQHCYDDSSDRSYQHWVQPYHPCIFCGIWRSSGIVRPKPRGGKLSYSLLWGPVLDVGYLGVYLVFLWSWLIISSVYPFFFFHLQNFLPHFSRFSSFFQRGDFVRLPLACSSCDYGCGRSVPVDARQQCSREIYLVKLKNGRRGG